MDVHLFTLTFIKVYHIKENIYAYKPHYSELKSTFIVNSFDELLFMSDQFNDYIKNSCKVTLMSTNQHNDNS